MGNLIELNLYNNQIADEGMVALGSAITMASLPKCTMIVVSGNPGNTAPLKAACEERGIALLN